jgi:hypothetical protein
MLNRVNHGAQNPAFCDVCDQSFDADQGAIV